MAHSSKHVSEALLLHPTVLPFPWIGMRHDHHKNPGKRNQYEVEAGLDRTSNCHAGDVAVRVRNRRIFQCKRGSGRIGHPSVVAPWLRGTSLFIIAPTSNGGEPHMIEVSLDGFDKAFGRVIQLDR